MELIGEWDDDGQEICESTGSRGNLEDVWTSQPLQAGETYVLQVTGYSDRGDCDTDQERDAGAAGNYALAVDCDVDEDEDDECTPGWHSVKCLDDGTVMSGEGCASCGDCAMYDLTAATGGLVTCERAGHSYSCLLYTSPSPRDKRQSRMPSSA